jgi:hypothetical protein
MFEQFLTNEGLLGEFVRKYNPDDHSGTPASDWIRDKAMFSPTVAVVFAFPWGDGEEWLKWRDVHVRWIGFMRDNGIKPNRSIPRDDIKDSLNRKTLKNIQDGNDESKQ